MADLKSIRLYGNQLVAVFDDGTKVMAYPTTSQNWIVKGASGGGPSPSGAFSYPFNPDLMTYGFRTASRPTHDGVDFAGGAASGGQPIPSMGAGTVYFADTDYFGYGQTVCVDHGTIAGYGNVKSMYAHMSLIGVTNGQAVTKGQTLGLIGETGASVGNHLHWEVWLNGTGSAANKIDPMAFMNDHGDGNWIRG